MVKVVKIELTEAQVKHTGSVITFCLTQKEKMGMTDEQFYEIWEVGCVLFTAVNLDFNEHMAEILAKAQKRPLQDVRKEMGLTKTDA